MTLDDLAGMREVRSEYLTSELPASTAVQVAALVVPDAMIEIDLVAVVLPRPRSRSSGSARWGCRSRLTPRRWS